MKTGIDTASAPAVIVVTREELAELIRGAVGDALADQREDAAPTLLLDRAGIARALGVATSTVDRLRREGLPSVMIGDSPRFIAQSCLEWLRANRGSK